MKIVIAPDSYKESLSALEVARAIEAGFRAVFPQAECVLVPVADGGEGTVDAMVAATGGRRETVAVSGPLGERVEAFYGLTGDGDTAVIEMAAASGLMLVPPARRDPLRTSSRILSSSSGVAARLTWPMTALRTAPWPMKLPTLIAGFAAATFAR